MILYALLMLVFLNVVLTVFAGRAAYRASAKRVIDEDAFKSITYRFDQLDSVVHRIDRATVGAQLMAQGVALGLDHDRQLTKNVADRLRASQAQADAVDLLEPPGSAADAGSRGPSDG